MKTEIKIKHRTQDGKVYDSVDEIKVDKKAPAIQQTMEILRQSCRERELLKEA